MGCACPVPGHAEEKRLAASKCVECRREEIQWGLFFPFLKTVPVALSVEPGAGGHFPTYPPKESPRSFK